MTKRLAPKHQRLVLLLIALVVLIAAGLIATWGLRTQASFFYVPSELIHHKLPAEQQVRLGGMVEKGSLKTEADGVTIQFIVGDGAARIPVRYTGIVPDLFTEGSGVVAEGKMRGDGLFVADSILAKHDENYIPRELKDMTEAQKRAAVAETTK